MFSYSYNADTQELTIYEHNMVLATISEVEEDNIEDMFKEIVYEMRRTDFLTDYEKMLDFLGLHKWEFLNSYSYLTEQEYDETMIQFKEDILGELVYLFRTAEQLMHDEVPRDIASDKEVIVSKAKELLSEEEYADFENLII